MRFRCKTHGVVLTVEGKIRRIVPPPGSWGNPCKLLTMHRIKKGKIGGCEIVEESES